ncbi:hypothetical protein PTSG_02396 [Salpingoeca rosetta]|uniref:Protein yippee-like n=1 Tax=Salpingoeca rosetta (strain ATCC 50818 / BSB-021) TaxID=946362 RepID=F2U230_SALR5|nr:uncharacterized protein PTSG_02396 [Salpingoeca rosetta]EGD81682.1 hypothetical protein PTSG_02396 [Salpingoeca rosetta]|eukprot:XP_004996886.1 hypothetical protein PTSG_02396 [Salpingoeca rosetta]
MGKLFREYLNNSCVYSCSNCHTHLAAEDALVSKAFQGRLGRAYLFNEVVNIECGPAEEKMLMTGLHSIRDVHCSHCRAYLGWKYEMAFEQEQKYKVGKVILEKEHTQKENGWR